MSNQKLSRHTNKKFLSLPNKPHKTLKLREEHKSHETVFATGISKKTSRSDICYGDANKLLRIPHGHVHQ